MTLVFVLMLTLNMSYVCERTLWTGYHEFNTKLCYVQYSFAACSTCFALSPLSSRLNVLKGHTCWHMFVLKSTISSCMPQQGMHDCLILFPNEIKCHVATFVISNDEKLTHQLKKKKRSLNPQCPKMPAVQCNAWDRLLGPPGTIRSCIPKCGL